MTPSFARSSTYSRATRVRFSADCMTEMVSAKVLR
jgi:hypothetical protein